MSVGFGHFGPKESNSSMDKVPDHVRWRDVSTDVG